MKNTTHDILCTCEPCRKEKGPMVKKGKPGVYTEGIEINYEYYELARFKNSSGIPYYKYVKREICHFCGKGYIISTKLFDRCARCQKDIKG